MIRQRDFRAWAAALLVGGLAASAAGDTVYLHDGRRVNGKVRDTATAAGVIEIETEAGLLRYRAAMVSRVEKNDLGVPGRPAESQPAANGSNGESAALRAEYVAAGRQADAAVTAAEGQAAWKAFLERRPDGPLAERARQELAVWNRRVAADLVRFGTEWIGRDESAQRQKKAEVLLAEAEATEDLAKAVALYDQAALIHPYLVEIPFGKGVRLYKADQQRQFGIAMGEAVKIRDDHPAARNNLGVLATVQGAWAAAFRNLAQAAGALDEDRILDNLDLAVVLAERANCPQALLAEGQRRMELVVAAHQDAGRHEGFVRWGNKWISEDEFDRLGAENEQLDKQVADLRDRLGKLDRQYREARKEKEECEQRMETMRIHEQGGDDEDAARATARMKRYMELQRKLGDLKKELADMEREGKGLRSQIDGLLPKKRVPDHARELVLLEADGRSELGRIKMIPDPPAPPKPAPKDKPAPKNKPAPKDKPADRPAAG